MLQQLLTEQPWLVVLILISIVIIACTAIVFVTDYLRRTHQAEIDATLKREMIARGLPAAEIKTILESTGDIEQLRASQQIVRLGNGLIEVGPSQPAPKRWNSSEATPG